jgi:hypothetical protein
MKSVREGCGCVHHWEQRNGRKNVRGGGAYQIVGVVLFCSLCVLHRQACVAKMVERGPQTVLDDAVKVVGDINILKPSGNFTYDQV